MVRLAYALTGDQGHAEDVAQAAFARAYAYWPKVRRTGNPEGYVRRIVINENRNRFVRRLRAHGPVGQGDLELVAGPDMGTGARCRRPGPGTRAGYYGLAVVDVARAGGVGVGLRRSLVACSSGDST